MMNEVIGKNEGCSARKLKEGPCGCRYEGRASAAEKAKAAGLGGPEPRGPFALLTILFFSLKVSSSMALNKGEEKMDKKMSTFIFFPKLCCPLVKK